MRHAFSFRQLFSALFIGSAILLAASALQAWTGPTTAPPGNNVAAPVNVGTSDQSKNGGLSVNALTVFGSQYIQTRLGVGVVSPVVAIETAGTLKVGNGAETCQSVTAGGIRYNTTSANIEYCNSSAWGAIGGWTASGSNIYYSTGKVGIGTSTPTDALSVHGVLRVGASSVAPLGIGLATSTFNGDVRIIGKMDVGTIDPVYTIGDTKYATYGHSTVGIKEEAALKATPVEHAPGSNQFVYTIDFDTIEKGSDLWLFYQITDFGPSWQNLVVSLTPEFDGRVFYTVDEARNELRIFASQSAPVSIRLLANRFDFSKWNNLRPDQDGDTAGTHIIPEK